MNKVLYHASQTKNIKVIKPQRTMSNDRYIGDFVFATANKKLAVMYLAPKGVATLMSATEDNPNIVICCDEKEFIDRDQGGAIYEVSIDSFTESPQKGLSEYEMVSKSEIKTLNKTVYNNTIKALISSGIKIRFTDEKTFNNLIGNPNQEKLIEKLKIYQPK